MSFKHWGFEIRDNITSTVILKADLQEGKDLGVFAKTWLLLALAAVGCFSAQAGGVSSQAPGCSSLIT